MATSVVSELSGVDTTIDIASGSGATNIPLRGTVTSAQYLRDIDVQVAIDSTKPYCGISGMVCFPGNRLVLSDSSNDCIKIVNLENDQVMAQLKLPSSPIAIRRVGNGVASLKVVFAMPYDQSVMFVAIRDDSLSIDRTIAVEGDGVVTGMDCRSDKLAMILYGNDGSEVQVLDLQGSLLFRFRTRRMRFFGNPTFSKDCTHLYVTESNHVVCIKLNGKIVAKYKDSDLLAPVRSIMDSSGNVFVCGLDSNNVHQLTKNCKKIRVMLTEVDGVDRPFQLCFSEDETRLYVCMRPNKVKVYTLQRTSNSNESRKRHACSIQ